MKVFGPMYERALAWSKHPRAPAFLTGLSFAEAVVFPIPPEVMLAPMSLSQPKRSFWFATLSLVARWPVRWSATSSATMRMN